MAVSEPRAKWAAGPLESATWERLPRPAPGHGHQHVSLPGQGLFMCGVRLPGGVRGNNVLTHTPSPLPLAAPREQSPIQPIQRAWLRGRKPAFQEKWKSQLRDERPVRHALSTSATSVTPSPSRTKHTLNGKGRAV